MSWGPRRGASCTGRAQSGAPRAQAVSARGPPGGARFQGTAARAQSTAASRAQAIAAARAQASAAARAQATSARQGGPRVQSARESDIGIPAAESTRVSMGPPSTRGEARPSSGYGRAPGSTLGVTAGTRLGTTPGTTLGTTRGTTLGVAPGSRRGSTLGVAPALGPRAGAAAASRAQPSASCGNVTCEQKAASKRGKSPPKDDDKSVARGVVEKQEQKKKQYELPALSILIPKKDVVKEMEDLKAKTRRRHAPEGEDTKAIREILKSMLNKEVTVHEFVGQLSPYTADNGTLLRTILANELSYFRTMARRVYDTMTQDVSDVLINEHVQLTEASKERHAQYTDKMMRAIDEIYEYVPQFNFEKYYSDPGYLEAVFPLVKETIQDEESEALQMRQEAYHRLMWLKSEGDRLGEENKRLSDRLKELKRRQKEQMKKASQIEKINEDKRKELEKTQEALEEQLEVMNSSIEKSIVQEEKSIRENEDRLPLPPAKGGGAVKKLVRKPAKKRSENWNAKAAAQIEETQNTEALVSEVSKVSMASSVSTSKASMGAVPKQRGKAKGAVKKKKFSKPKVPQDKDPFHFSPIKTPPRPTQARERSPFHYSPPKTPPRDYRDELGALPNTETTRIRTRTVDTEEAPQRPAPPRLGRSGASAPRDSWGGFF